ncbi:MAG: hypothetical protein JO340_07595 [Acidobacteriaceae bacterium]|nr:hypothetical protein [Acidobacteriaceae bacterium]
MADQDSPVLDLKLDRLSKLSGIFVPIVIGLVGGYYACQKDCSDREFRIAEQKRNEDQREFDNTQKQYANLSALLPLLTSGKQDLVEAAVDVYTSEAKTRQAPTDLQDTIEKLKARFPELANPIDRATEAGQRQICKLNPDGLYIQVANDSNQLALGKDLDQRLTKSGISPAVQGVQRIDAGPRTTELRYYFSQRTNAQADQIIRKLNSVGIQDIQKADLSAEYLKPGCSPPAVYELWIGTSSPLTQH